MVSQPVCGAAGPGRTAGAHAARLQDRGAPPGRAARRRLPSGRGVRALGRVADRLKESVASAGCLEPDRRWDLRGITLHDVVPGPSVGAKRGLAKRGFFLTLASQLNAALG